MGRWEECPLCNPMVDLSYVREGAGLVGQIYVVDGMEKNKKKQQ